MTSTRQVVRRMHIRQEANRIEAAGGHGRFRRRRMPEHTPVAEALVLDAVIAAKAGDQDAIRFLYLRFADNVYGYVCSIVRDEHDAEDVTQQVFAKLTGALGRYEPRAVPFSAWILRVAHNAAIDHVRTRRAVPCEEVRSPDLEAEDVGRERSEALRLALATLPEDQRQVLALRFIAGMSPGEIAKKMGRSEDAVHGLQHRGRRTLRLELERLEAAPAALR
jgi:RNA polymerase sigma-70 factor (ECF subfamily)